MAVSVLTDIEARADGAPFRARLCAIRPSTILFDFGGSRFGRAVLALRAVDAVAVRFPSARFRIRGGPVTRGLLRAHLEALRPSWPRPGATTDLVLDFAPGVRQRPAWRETAPPTLRLAAVPYPERRQHAADHWVDAAQVAGFDPIRQAPELRLPRQALRAAQSILAEAAGVAPVVILAPRPAGWPATSLRTVGLMLADKIGAHVMSVGGLDSIPALPEADPAVVAAALRLATVVVGDAGGWCDVAAAAGGAVVAIHGKSSPERHGPASRLGASISASCRDPWAHRPPRASQTRCLRCLQSTPVVDLAEELAARRWPRDIATRLAVGLLP